MIFLQSLVPWLIAILALCLVVRIMPRRFQASFQCMISASPSSILAEIYKIEEHAIFGGRRQEFERMEGRDGLQVWSELLQDSWYLLQMETDDKLSNTTIQILDQRTDFQMTWQICLTPAKDKTLVIIKNEVTTGHQVGSLILTRLSYWFGGIARLEIERYIREIKEAVETDL